MRTVKAAVSVKSSVIRTYTLTLTPEVLRERFGLPEAADFYICLPDGEELKLNDIKNGGVEVFWESFEDSECEEVCEL